jgi:uncharacterized membrane protein YqjE
MSDPEPERGGLRSSAGRIVETAIGLFASRVELFGVELREEQLRLIRWLAWFGLVFAFGLAGILIGLAALSLFLWNTAGYVGLVGLSVVTLGAAAALFRWLHRQITSSTPPFEATVDELRKDRECLHQPD